MKIISLAFEDKTTGLKIEEIYFDDLTLLVGASGMGKTKILQALNMLAVLRDGNNIGEIIWHLAIQIEDNQYTWEGAFGEQHINVIEGEEGNSYFMGKSSILYERLYINNHTIVEREGKKILFKGNETIKLSQSLSIINLLQEEDEIHTVYSALDNVHLMNYSSITNETEEKRAIGGINEKLFQKLYGSYNSIETIRKAKLPIGYKLALLFHSNKSLFDKIKTSFIRIFPTVEEIKMQRVLSTIVSDTTTYTENLGFIIKERGVKNPFPSPLMSSGMERTLIFLSELFLCPDGTVFLIDEFENSLGINCINELVNLMLTNRRPLQFILTSHHPYIIDAIGHKHWKLVTRNGSVIKTHDMDKFNIGKSKHSSFMQLLQLEEYQTGIERV